MVSKQWIVNCKYSVENSALYLNLPISFNSFNYIIEMTDMGGACASFGAEKISTSKFRVHNVGFSGKAISEIETSGYGGYVLALGWQ